MQAQETLLYTLQVSGAVCEITAAPFLPVQLPRADQWRAIAWFTISPERSRAVTSQTHCSVRAWTGFAHIRFYNIPPPFKNIQSFTVIKWYRSCSILEALFKWSHHLHTAFILGVFVHEKVENIYVFHSFFFFLLFDLVMMWADRNHDGKKKVIFSLLFMCIWVKQNQTVIVHLEENNPLSVKWLIKIQHT